MTFAEDVRKIARQQLRIEVMKVLELSDDDSKVTLDDGSGAPLNDVPCLSSYADRAPGDHVLVVKMGGSWCVLGATGKVPSAQGPDEATVKNWINQSSGSPDATPDPVTVPTTDARAYRTNGQESKTLYSGPATPWGLPARWTTAFFYGDALQNALNAGTIDYVTCTISRIAGPGWNDREPIRLGMHSHKTLTKVTSLDSQYVAAKLAWNGRAVFHLSDSFISALQSGSESGLGITSTVSGEYLGVTASSGKIQVVYK